MGTHQGRVSPGAGAVSLFGAVWYRAEVLINLGDTYEAAGDRQAARELWQEALEVFEQTHHPGTERLRTKMQASQ